jgi:hypothetical protein
MATGEIGKYWQGKQDALLLHLEQLPHLGEAFRDNKKADCANSANNSINK